jgi:hypothetical protein
MTAGVETTTPVEYLHCPYCDYERDLKKPGEKAWKRVDKDSFRKEGGDNADRHKKRDGTSRGTFEKSRVRSGNSFR